MKTKTCYVCKDEKNMERFALANNSGRNGDGRAHYCLECSAKLTEREKRAIVTRLWRQNNKERHDARHKDYNLQRTYGVSLDDYNAMLKKQNSVCAVCGEASTIVRKSDGRLHSLCVDHDHETGKVRALLCVRCNTLLELIEQNPRRLAALKKYLEQHKKGDDSE